MMMSMAAIAGPRRGLLSWSPMVVGHVVVDAAEKQSSFGKSTRATSCAVVRALRVKVRGRRVYQTPLGLNVAFARASPLLFQALPEDGAAVEAEEEVSADPAAEAPTYEGPIVKVRFELQRECHFGQQFKVVGGDSQFGDWDPSAGVTLSWSEGHLWTTEVDVPKGKKFEYKYVLTGQEGEIEWQPGFNHVLETAAGAELLVISVGWEEIQSEPTAELEVQPAEPEAESAGPEIPFAEPEAESAGPEIPFAELEAESAGLEAESAEPESQSAEPESQSAEPESQSAEPESQSAELEFQSAEPESQSAEPESQSAEPVAGDWQTFSADAEASTPADALADVAASAVIGALNAGVKAATALEGTLDAVQPVSQPPSSEKNGVAESKTEETPTAIEIPIVDAALAATAEPAAPVEEPQSTNNGASTSTSNQADSATTEEKPSTEEESRIEEEAQQSRIDEQQPTTEKEPKKGFNPFQKDIAWLAKTLFGR